MSKKQERTQYATKELQTLASFIDANMRIVVDLIDLKAEQLNVTGYAPIGRMIAESASNTPSKFQSAAEDALLDKAFGTEPENKDEDELLDQAFGLGVDGEGNPIASKQTPSKTETNAKQNASKIELTATDLDTTRKEFEAFKDARETEQIEKALTDAGCIDLTAAKAVLEDHENDVSKLKEGCPYLFDGYQHAEVSDNALDKAFGVGGGENGAE